MFGISFVLPTICAERFPSAPVIADVGFVNITTQLIEFTIEWQLKEKERGKANE